MHEIIAGRHVDADLPGRGVRWTGTAYAAPPTLPDRLTAGVPQRPLSGRGAHHFHTSFARLSHGFRAAFARHGTADLAPSRGLRTPGPPAGGGARGGGGPGGGARGGGGA